MKLFILLSGLALFFTSCNEKKNNASFREWEATYERKDGEEGIPEARVRDCLKKGMAKVESDFSRYPAMLSSCQFNPDSYGATVDYSDRENGGKTTSVVDCVIKMAMFKNIEPNANPWIEEKCKGTPQAFDHYYQ